MPELSPTARLSAELFAPVTAEATGSKATMRVFGRIDPDGAPWGISAEDVQGALDGLPDDVTDLEVQIHSRGGDAFEGFAIMNMIRGAKQATEAVVLGVAASAASYIAMGADKVTMAPHSQMMIHRGSALAFGQAPDMRSLADRLDAIDANMASIYAEKAGGTVEEWLAAMTPESWYSADEAAKAGLADGTREDAKKPDGVKAALDLTIFAYAGRDHAPKPFMPTAPQTPAETPVAPSTTPEEADTMSDTIPKAVCEALGLSDDADEATVTAAAAALKTERDEALASVRPKPKPDLKDATAALEADGKVVISADVLDELRIAARAGAEARAVQLRQDRDATISAAITGGHVSRDRRQHWTEKWDADPEGIRAALEELCKGEPIFPIGDAPGHGNDLAVSTEYDDEKAAQDAELFGLPKEAFSA